MPTITIHVVTAVIHPTDAWARRNTISANVTPVATTIKTVKYRA